MTAAPFYYTPGSFDVVDPLVIVRVIRTGEDSSDIVIYGTVWSRILIYVGASVVFDSDIPGDAITILTDTDGNTRISIGSLETGLGRPPGNGSLQATALDQVLTTQSDPTAFTIPRFGVASAPRMRNRLRVR